MKDDIASVLIVEDEPTLRDVYRTILSMQGMHVATASNGRAALEHIARDEPDVILLDVLMPEMDGREFLRNFDSSAHPDIKIIVSSNVADNDIIREMLSLGAHDHVVKSSITPNGLVEIVQQTAEKSSKQIS